MKKLISLCSVSILSAISSQGAVTVHYTNDFRVNPLRDFDGRELSPGAKGQALDGAAIEVGYYSLATTSNPFAGTWVPLVAEGIGGSYVTIGDGAGDVSGFFEGSSVFNATPPAGVVYPSAGTPLAIRFYDASLSSGPTHYNAVSYSSWLWRTPTSASYTIELEILPWVVWQGGQASAYRTTMPYPNPEPSSVMLSMAGAIMLLSRRNRG